MNTVERHAVIIVVIMEIVNWVNSVILVYVYSILTGVKKMTINIDFLFFFILDIWAWF